MADEPKTLAQLVADVQAARKAWFDRDLDKSDQLVLPLWNARQKAHRDLWDGLYRETGVDLITLQGLLQG